MTRLFDDLDIRDVDIREGDIVVAHPDPSNNDPDINIVYVLVLIQSIHVAECVLITRHMDLAIQRDIILGTEETGIDGDLVIHTLTGVDIPYSRLTERVGRVDGDVLDEIIATRYSAPTGKYRCGVKAHDGDPRADRIIRLYTNFRRFFD